MPNETVTEDKGTVDEQISSAIDAKMDALGADGTPAGSSPANEAAGDAGTSTAEPVQSAPETGSESGSPKTGTPGQDADGQSFDDVPKGFAAHPAWQKQQERIKQAEARLKERETQLQGFGSLLRDPVVFQRFLANRGYSPEMIREEMQKRGMAQTSSPEAKKPLFERVSQKLYGEKMAGLNEDQLNQLKDIVALVEATTQELVGEEIAPVRSFVDERRRLEMVDSQLEQARKEASEYGIDFDKEAAPLMSYLFDQARQADPTFQIGAVDLFYRAANRILRDRAKSATNGAARTAAKGVARPLTATGVRPNAPAKRPALKTDDDVNSEIDRFLDGVGFKP